MDMGTFLALGVVAIVGSGLAALLYSYSTEKGRREEEEEKEKEQ